MCKPKLDRKISPKTSLFLPHVRQLKALLNRRKRCRRRNAFFCFVISTSSENILCSSESSSLSTSPPTKQIKSISLRLELEEDSRVEENQVISALSSSAVQRNISYITVERSSCLGMPNSSASLRPSPVFQRLKRRNTSVKQIGTLRYKRKFMDQAQRETIANKDLYQHALSSYFDSNPHSSSNISPPTIAGTSPAAPGMISNFTSTLS